MNFTTFLTDYRYHELSSNDDPFADMTLESKNSKEPAVWEFAKSGSDKVMRYLGNDIAIEFPTVIKDRKATGVAGAISDVPENYTRLVSVIIPEGYTSIGRYAFYGCSSLEPIVLPSTLKTIDIHAFAECEKLKSIVIPPDVEVIGRSAFAGCHALEEICIPDKVKLSKFKRLKVY